MGNPLTSARLRRSTPLSGLPRELLSEILGYTCLHDTAIRPERWLPDSSQFAHYTTMTTMRDGYTFRTPARTDGFLPRALTVVDLRSVCRLFNKILEEDNLFYKWNIFEFTSFQTMLDYFKALPPSRRQAIRNILLLYNDVEDPEPALVVLSSLANLKYLTIDVSRMAQYLVYSSSFRQAPGYFSLTTLRGLNNLTLTYDEHGGSALIPLILQISQWDPFPLTEDEICLGIAELEQELNAVTQLPRSNLLTPSPSELAQALSHSTVVEGKFLIKKHNAIAISAPKPEHVTNLSELEENKSRGGARSKMWPDLGYPSPWGVTGEWKDDKTPENWVGTSPPTTRRHLF